ncbi:hypothetical protein R3I94_017771 [Phoxinus phoxinus]
MLRLRFIVRCHSRYTNSDLHTEISSSGSCWFDWETLRRRQRSHDHQSRSEATCVDERGSIVLRPCRCSTKEPGEGKKQNQEEE